MKTYKQFVEGCGCPYSKKKKKTENVTEVVALAPLAIPVGKAIGAGLAATGLTGMIMQARKQGEGKRSQPVDYGQGGTATPGPGRSTQRTHRKDRSAQRQSDQAREDRRAEARLRAKERKEAEQRDVEQKIDDLIGSQADRRYAKQRRAEENKKRQERNLDKLVDKASRELGVKLPEGNKLGEGMLPVPSDKRKRIINPMIAAMPPKTEKGINDAMKKGLDKLDKKMDRMYKDLNSVPKDRGKA